MMNRKMVLMVLGVVLCAGLARGAAPTFQELMDPAVFPDAQRGMVVESATLDSGNLRVVTTGAEMTLDKSGKAVFRQRIGHPREVVTVTIEGGVAGPGSLTHSGPGLAFARFDKPRLDVRANGDSLFMFHAREPLTIEVRRGIDAGFSSSYDSNHLILDEWGGFGIYCSEKLDDAFDPFADVTARYALPKDAVLWITVCPPKPYDWDRSFKDHVVWHWSNESGYPTDADLIAWSKEGNIVLLQSEILLWKDWNLAFVPRLGEAEFARVRKTMHDHGQRFIVYTSPAYFFKGTPFEQHAFNTFENFTNWPPARGLGDNIDLFLAEITKVMTEYKPDGLYFDGQYFSSPAALYTLARRTRALLGEDGILEWHSTTALGEGLCYLPQADAYVDFILRGEGRDSAYTDEAYLRYFVSGYNAHNSIGVLCNNGPRPTAELIRRVLAVNGRIHTIASWLSDPALVELIHTEYKARLTPALREEVERNVNEAQKQVAARAAILAQEHRAIEAAPVWKTPLLKQKFDAIPEWERVVSPQNVDPFSVANGAMAITAKAHTYAYLKSKLGGTAQGFVVKLRQNTDAGMSWGPAVCLEWKNGARLRLGARSDGALQSDIGGEQRLIGQHDPAQWIWLRARWLGHSGIIESSTDGTNFRRLWTFDHGGALTGELASLSVGKVPFNNEPKDHSEPGPAGTCFIEEVAVY